MRPNKGNGEWSTQKALPSTVAITAESPTRHNEGIKNGEHGGPSPV